MLLHETRLETYIKPFALFKSLDNHIFFDHCFYYKLLYWSYHRHFLYCHFYSKRITYPSLFLVKLLVIAKSGIGHSFFSAQKRMLYFQVEETLIRASSFQPIVLEISAQGYRCLMSNSMSKSTETKKWQKEVMRLKQRYNSQAGSICKLHKMRQLSSNPDWVH